MDPAVLETQHDAAVELDHGGLAVRVGGLVEVQGDPVPDDACCTMPESRWYLTLDGRVPETRVALGEVCAVRPEAASHGAHEPWSSTGSNNLQYGRFGARP